MSKEINWTDERISPENLIQVIARIDSDLKSYVQQTEYLKRKIEYLENQQREQSDEITLVMNNKVYKLKGDDNV